VTHWLQHRIEISDKLLGNCRLALHRVKEFHIRGPENILTKIPVVVTGLLAIAILLALAVHIGSSWIGSVNQELTRDRTAFEHAQAWHSASEDLRTNLLDLDGAAMNFPDSGREERFSKLLRKFATVVANRPRQTEAAHKINNDVEALFAAAALARLSSRPGDARPKPSEQLPPAAKRALRDIHFELAEMDNDEQRELRASISADRGIGRFTIGVASEILLAFLSALVSMWLFLKAASQERSRRSLGPRTHSSKLFADYEMLKAEVLGCSGPDGREAGGTRAAEIARPIVAITKGERSAGTSSGEAELRHLLDTSSVAMYVKDAAGRYLMSNVQFDALLCPQSATAGKTDYDLFEADTANVLWNSDIKALELGVPLQSEESLRTGDGQGTFLAVKLPLFNAGDNPYAVCGFLIRLGALEREDVRLRDTRALRAALESMKDGVVILDTTGFCLFSNPAAEELLGNKLTEKLVKDWAPQLDIQRDGISSLDPIEDFPLVQALSGRAVQPIDICVQAAAGSQRVWLAASAMPLTDESGRICGAAGVFSDVTERRNGENALKHAKEEAECANRAKSEFLSRVSHELRTPLNAILGFAQLLQMSRLPDHHQDSVEQILKGGRHLLALINEVLDIARIESGHLSISLERIAAPEVIQEAVTLIEPQAAKLKIQLYIEAGPAWRSHITADRQRFKQVVLNLISNAVKYNHEGGSVRISAEIRGPNLKLNIADTGPGIASEKLHLLFSPFERLGAEHGGVEGTGIGLALSKRLVEAMSGRIGFENQAGSGATFWIEFPVADANASHENDDLRHLGGSIASDRPAVVLCIEDNASNFHLIERTFSHRPEIKLICGTLGASALALAEANRPDVILLDMHLPDLEGDEVLDILRSHRATAEIPVIVVSADATPRQVERMLDAGASAYLTKPLDIQKLLQVVDEAIGKGVQSGVPCTKV